MLKLIGDGLYSRPIGTNYPSFFACCLQLHVTEKRLLSVCCYVISNGRRGWEWRNCLREEEPGKGSEKMLVD